MSQTDNEKRKADEVDGGKTPRLKVDEAIKYLFTSEKQALIRFINNALGESYDPDTTEFIALSTEFVFQNTISDESATDSFDLARIRKLTRS